MSKTVPSETMSDIIQPSMTEQVATKAHEAIDRAAVHVRDAEVKARDVAATSVQKLEATQEQAKQQLDVTISKLDGFIRAQPIAAAGIAFAAGIVAAVLLRR